MFDPPKISVIIPVYNSERYLRECLDSVAGQTFRDIEIICVNDYSRDGSLSILEEYAGRDGRIRIINNITNLRAGESRNRGMKEAKGEYVHFLDADDYLVEDAYEVLYRKASQYNLDLVQARIHGIDEATQKKQYDPTYDFAGLSAADFDVVVNFTKMPEKFLSISAAPWNGLYRRSLLLEKGLFFNNLKCVNDRSFYMAVVLNAGAAMFIDRYILFHRINIPTSLVGVRAKNFECHFKSYEIVKKMSEHYPDHLKYRILENELHDMFFWFRKYQNEHILEKEIYSQTRMFVDNLDITPFGENLPRCRWYRQYLKIKDPDAYYKRALIPRRLQEALWAFLATHKTTENIYKFLIAREEEGLKTALRKAIKRIMGTR